MEGRVITTKRRETKCLCVSTLHGSLSHGSPLNESSISDLVKLILLEFGRFVHYFFSMDE